MYIDSKNHYHYLSKHSSGKMSGVGLVSDYNNDSEEISETEDKKAAYEQVNYFCGVLYFSSLFH